MENIFIFEINILKVVHADYLSLFVTMYYERFLVSSEQFRESGTFRRSSVRTSL